MFDIGFTELMLLAVIGLLVLGPEKLPRVARTLGGLTRKARSSWINLKRSIDAEINAEELKKPLQKMQDDVRSAVDQVDSKLKKATDSVSSAGKTNKDSKSDGGS
jgi:sec-independent protein translocase protein TatB